jgi:hypothetical protein
MRRLLLVLALLWTAGIAAPAHAQYAGGVPVPLLGQPDPCPGATLCGSFVGTPAFKSGGSKTSVFTALPNLTVTRASGAYGENADGSLVWFQANQPRLTTKGLGVFEATTNLVLNSQALASTGWSPNQTPTIANNVVVAPDGTTTGTQIVAGGSIISSGAFQSMTVTNATVYTWSVYVKNVTGSGLLQVGVETPNARLLINPSGCGISSPGGSLTSYGSYAVAGGWCRVWGTFTSTTTSAVVDAYSGDATAKTFSVWGYDLRAGAYPVPYCPTTSSTATCAADVVGLPSYSWASAGTVLASYLQPAGTAASVSRIIGSTTGQAAPLFINSSGTLGVGAQAVGTYNGTTSLVGPTYAGSRVTDQKIAAGVAWTGSSRLTYANGAQTASDANAGGFTTGLWFGNNNATDNFLNGYLTSFAVYPTTFSSAQLQAATSGTDLSSLSLNFAAGLYKTTTPYVRTNLLLQSQNFGASPWAVGTATVNATATTAPDNTLTGNKLQEDSSNGTHQTAQSLTKAASAITYTTSYYAKAAERSWVMLTVYDGSAVADRQWVNLASCTVGTHLTVGGGFSGFSAGSVSVGNGWCRNWITATSNTTTAFQAFLYTANADAVFSYQGVTGSGVYLWQAQTEAQGSPSSNITTTTAATSVATTQSTNPADVGNLSYTGPAGYAPDCNGNLVNFAANVPRITCAGVLIEEARTNYATYSQQFDQGAQWIGSPTGLTANAGVAPDGTVTAYSWSGGGRLLEDLAAAGNGAYSNAIYGKTLTGSPSVTVVVKDRQTDVVRGTTTLALTSAWQRAVATGTTAGASTGERYEISVSGGTALIWQADAQPGAFITSPILTTSGTATRAADVMSYGGLSIVAPTTFAAQGVGYSQDGVTRRFLTLSDGTVSNRVMLSRLSDNSVSASAVNGGAAQGSSVALSGVTGAFNVSAVSNLAAGVYKSAANGTLAGASNSSAPSVTFSRLDVGQAPDGTGTFNGSIPQIRLYPYAANDNELTYRSAGNF